MILTTPFSHSTDILSSTPLTPLGILRKSSRPDAFCSALNVQWSDDVNCRSPLNNHTRHGLVHTNRETDGADRQRYTQTGG